jgi:hypothetical protein
MSHSSKRRKIVPSKKPAIVFQSFYTTLKLPGPATFGASNPNLSTSLLLHILQWLSTGDLIENVGYTNSVWYSASRSWIVWQRRALDFASPAIRALVRHYQQNSWMTQVASLEKLESVPQKWFENCAVHLKHLEMIGEWPELHELQRATQLQTLYFTDADVSDRCPETALRLDANGVWKINMLISSTVETVFFSTQGHHGIDCESLREKFPNACQHLFARGSCSQSGQLQYFQVCMSKHNKPDPTYKFPNDRRCQFCEHWGELSGDYEYIRSTDKFQIPGVRTSLHCAAQLGPKVIASPRPNLFGFV